MNEEIKVTKEFLERLNKFLELVNITEYDNENDLLISLLLEYLIDKVSDYEEALERDNHYKASFIDELKRIEKEKPIRVNNINELFDDYELGDGEFGKREAQKALKKCRKSYFDDLIKFIQPDYPHNCSDCVYFNPRKNYETHYNCSIDWKYNTGINGLEKACTNNFTYKNELTNFLMKCVKDYDASDIDFNVLKEYVKMYDNDKENKLWWTE